jgi:hypothetical protein
MDQIQIKKAESELSNRKKLHREARNEFSNFVYDRLRHFMQHTNSTNIAKQVKDFVNDVTDVALGPEK